MRAGTSRKEVGGFLVVGVLAVVLDFALFNALLIAGVAVWAANAVALFASMSFAFIGNYKWTFAHRQVKSLIHAYSAFAGINLLAVLFITDVNGHTVVLKEFDHVENLLDSFTVFIPALTIDTFKIKTLCSILSHQK